MGGDSGHLTQKLFQQEQKNIGSCQKQINIMKIVHDFSMENLCVLFLPEDINTYQMKKVTASTIDDK